MHFWNSQTSQLLNVFHTSYRVFCIVWPLKQETTTVIVRIWWTIYTYRCPTPDKCFAFQDKYAQLKCNQYDFWSHLDPIIRNNIKGMLKIIELLTVLTSLPFSLLIQLLSILLLNAGWQTGSLFLRAPQRECGSPRSASFDFLLPQWWTIFHLVTIFVLRRITAQSSECAAIRRTEVFSIR